MLSISDGITSIRTVKSGLGDCRWSYAPQKLFHPSFFLVCLGSCLLDDTHYSYILVPYYLSKKLSLSRDGQNNYLSGPMVSSMKKLKKPEIPMKF